MVGWYVPSGVAVGEWAIATLARARVLAEHTANHRDAQLEDYIFGSTKVAIAEMLDFRT